MTPALLLLLAALVALVAVALSEDDVSYASDMHARPRKPVWVQVVVARYAEDVSWLEKLPFRDILVIDKYDKQQKRRGDPPPYAKVVKLENVGRCDHSYNHHIITHYDRLADVTLFVPGSCAAFKSKWSKLEWVVKHVCRTGSSAFAIDERYSRPVHEEQATFQIDNYMATGSANAAANPEVALQKSEHRPFGKFFKHHFPEHPGVHELTYQGIFAVAREHIRQTPRATYARLCSELDSHSNPEAGHYVERCWMALFHPVPRSCMSLPDRDWGETGFMRRWVSVSVVLIVLLLARQKISVRM